MFGAEEAYLTIVFSPSAPTNSSKICCPFSMALVIVANCAAEIKSKYLASERSPAHRDAEFQNPAILPSASDTSTSAENVCHDPSLAPPIFSFSPSFFCASLFFFPSMCIIFQCMSTYTNLWLPYLALNRSLSGISPTGFASKERTPSETRSFCTKSQKCQQSRDSFNYDQDMSAFDASACMHSIYHPTHPTNLEKRGTWNANTYNKRSGMASWKSVNTHCK